MKKLNDSIRAKFIVYTAVPLSLFFVALQSYHETLLRTEKRVEMELDLQLDATILGNKVDRALDGLSHLAELNVAHMEATSELTEEHIVSVVEHMVRENPLVNSATIAFDAYKFSDDVRLYAPLTYYTDTGLKTKNLGNPDPAIGYDYIEENRAWWRSPLNRKSGTWTLPYFDEGGANAQIISYAAPFYRDDQFFGVVTVNVELATFIEKLGLNKRESLTVIDKFGNFILQPDHQLDKKNLLELDSQYERQEARLALNKIRQKRNGFYELPRKDVDDSTWIGFAFVPATGWYLLESISKSAALEPLQERMLVAIVSELISLLVLLAILWYLSGKLTRPIKKISAAAQRVAKGDMSTRIISNSNDELGTLVRDFNTISEIVEQREEDLQRKVDERTQELVASQKEIKEKNNLLEAQINEISAAKEQAEKATLAKSELLSVATHDLKNPLAAISGLSQIMLETRQQSKDDPEKEFLLNINESATHMFEIVKGILANEGLEQKGIQFSENPIDVYKLTKSCVEFNQINAKHKDINIAINETEPLYIRGDEIKLREAIDNYVNNAVKYSPPGSTVKVNVEKLDAEEAVIVEVWDKGPGLSEEDKEKLFGRFQRLSAKPTGNESSTGLGLSIVKTIVELHGGHVGCNSELGQGACFWMKFKQAHV